MSSPTIAGYDIQTQARKITLCIVNDNIIKDAIIEIDGDIRRGTMLLQILQSIMCLSQRRDSCRIFLARLFLALVENFAFI